MDQAERGLYDLLVERLTADPQVDGPLSRVVLAAWASDESLAAVLGGSEATTLDAGFAPLQNTPPDVYLAAVHVEGFRGIGSPATLPLRPGAGLTLVTGRNGSGKLISVARSTREKVTLAVFDDPGRGSELLGTVRSEQGGRAVDALQHCRQGAHHGLDGDLRPFVADVERLAAWIQR